MTLVPALEVGGTHVTAALVRLAADGGPVVLGASRHELAPAEPAELILNRIAACASAVAVPVGATWGVAMPGPFDYARGVGLFKDVGKFDALNGVDLNLRLRDLLPSRPRNLVFLNDAEAFLRGEWMAGAAHGHERAIGITLGTGIGSAFLARGRAVRAGPQVPPEGSVHLLTVRGRPLEDIVSSRAIASCYTAATGSAGIDVRTIADRARGGELAAREVLQSAFRTLGQALARWVARFDPSVVVVGGAIARSWDLVAEPLAAGMRSPAPSGPGPAVVPAAHPEEAALIGAAWQALGPPRGSGV